MTRIIPISQLTDETSGIRMDRINDAYVEAIIDTIGEAHRNDHYICVLLEMGIAELIVDFKSITLESNNLLFLYPDQVKNVISFNKSEGWILFFNRSMLSRDLSMTLEEPYYGGSFLELSSMQRDWFHSGFELLRLTIQSDEMSNFKRPTIENVLNACLYKISSIYNSKNQLDKENHSVRSIDITRTFRKLILRHYRTKKRPSDYAEMMHLSAGYLNDTVKKVIGQNITSYIQQVSITEAQRLLYHTTLSIKEIAEKVGYDDPQYFSRVFSKITQQTPGNFRKKTAHLSAFLQNET